MTNDQKPVTNDRQSIPVNFMTFLLSLAGAIQLSLGLVPNPQTGKPEKNLNLAKETMDILEMMKEKTKGNLTKEESDLFEHLLYELRMAYLEASK
ncbi:MAG: hypothetical protein COV46_08270 [Deltaproteobacteria bacterium CG11_big_fil_rev_8_21_14_0_20_49_13]|nr:MAG: hypothetical protein COV46_08270 [Deltaproteobacteria bacterium CG11_big_fil_rev_8_21_14_0_20_49_13]